MNYRTGNYVAFYVDEPFYEGNLGAYAAYDFCYYQMIKTWNASDSDFHFVNSHDKTYNVRDDSSWEFTLKPRLHDRLSRSKNIILILSSHTKYSRALREEMDYGINTCGLPVIVLYPDFSLKTDIVDSKGNFLPQIIKLWDKLPIFRDSMDNVATVHIPFQKQLLKKVLNDPKFTVQLMGDGQYFFPV